MTPGAEITVRDVMTVEPIKLDQSSTIQQALQVMNGLRVGAVLVTKDEKLVGIFTERDVLKRAADAPPGWRQGVLADWMSPDPYVISPDEGWESAVTSLERLRVRHLPVVENSIIVGIVSSRQLMSRRTQYLNRLIELRTQETQQAYEELLARDAEQRHNMKAAAKLQRLITLPQSPPDRPECAWGIYYAPLEPLGGDYYDFAFPDADHMGILIADASGHSIPAAMVAVMARLAFAQVSPHTNEPGHVLAEMNRRLAEMADERFVTAFYGVLNVRTLKFRYANAGHPFPYRFTPATGKVEPLQARGFLLGISPEEVYTPKEVQLTPGDRLCFHTDGIADCRNDRGDSYGTERIATTFGTVGHMSAKRVAERLNKTLAAFRGSQKAIDDMTLVVAELQG